ncbi:glycoside hydrolase family 88 protein [Pseudonocardia kunmingensis]|uniref:Unsaturated chondroitin disaccharide hydrolase n=1 Tax=Pseudonocardia kunmingensis TaxID=630975 RepID=A0A543DVF5_9PSEU|nr:glycoside hydrolase family 88 protein [Pseudonocardia kunmingensis]TQM13296.1 unsaturated chondroitin disaccharide hydrolase [Pseudonocardia kunmingensis]
MTTTHDTTARQEVAHRAMDQVRVGCQQVVRLMQQAPDGAVPRFSYRTGGYELAPAYQPDSWATFQWVGFLTGRLWLVAEHFGDEGIARVASRLAYSVADCLSRRPPGFSAAGCDLFYAACLGARCSGDAALAATARAAVDRYAENFDRRVGVFFQVPGVNRAVIDTGLNLLPFYWAAGDDPARQEIAVRHNATLLAAGIVRPEGSTYQAIEFDLSTGEPVRRWNMQGYSDESTWARGQSWALHNYVNVYEATGDPGFLEVARRVCRWYVDHLPGDHVPFYDFADPQAPAVPRDSCSASIAANALLRLARLDPESAGWAQPAGDAIVDELLLNYLSPGGVLLHGSWGPLAPEKVGARISRFPLEDVMPYGNYWVVEALYRRLHDDWALLALDGNRASS